MSHRYWANLSTCTRLFTQISEYRRQKTNMSTGPGSRVRVQVPKYGSPNSVLFRSRFPSTGPGSRVQILNFFLNFFANLFKNVLSFIFGLLLDAVLVCHVIWVVGFQSGLKKIGSSQIYEVEKLAQYRWDIHIL